LFFSIIYNEDLLSQKALSSPVVSSVSSMSFSMSPLAPGKHILSHYWRTCLFPSWNKRFRGNWTDKGGIMELLWIYGRTVKGRRLWEVLAGDPGQSPANGVNAKKYFSICYYYRPIIQKALMIW